jgi:hypothetical protein
MPPAAAQNSPVPPVPAIGTGARDINHDANRDARHDATHSDNNVSDAGVETVVSGILSYARWPVEPDPLQVCVIFDARYAGALLDRLTQSGGRTVHVQRMAPDDERLASYCNVVYLGAAPQIRRQALFERLAGHAVLSISERGDSCSAGSMFCLRVRADQVSFEVNLDSIARSGVRVHPSVLQLARPKAVQP